MGDRNRDGCATAQSTQIALLAARLMAEEGVVECAAAKRKAVQRLGLPAGTALPEDAEVEAELRLRQRLFDSEHGARLACLRRKALDCMRLLRAFRPYLSGSVLDGTAGSYAEIDVQLFPDSAKDVEIFLLNRRIPFAHSVPRSERAEMVLTLDDDEGVVINLVLYAAGDERVALRTRDGRVRPRAGIDAVAGLLGERD